ncbi:hypothetical protein DFJ73DRAFT_813977 [Zopfochytrium polystomum]|nr:hypothetical protein DFJ73DRAFT_813977 [Zopfochytrium polystomum]
MLLLMLLLLLSDLHLEHHPNRDQRLPHRRQLRLESLDPRLQLAVAAAQLLLLRRERRRLGRQNRVARFECRALRLEIRELDCAEGE